FTAVSGYGASVAPDRWLRQRIPLGHAGRRHAMALAGTRAHHTGSHIFAAAAVIQMEPQTRRSNGQGETSVSTHAPPSAAVRTIEQTRWRIDPARSSLAFQVPHFWGLTTVEGRFERYDGTLEISAQPAVELRIDAASLDTKRTARDKHLRSADFFDVEKYPQV